MGPDTSGRTRFPDWVVGVGAAGLSGAMMAACYPPLNFHGLAWVALVPWLLVLPRLSASKAWLIGTLVGLVFYRVGLRWLFAFHGPLGGISIAILAVWMGFSFRVARMTLARFSPAAMLWVVPLTFVGQEVLRCEALPRFRFPFLALGYSQSGNLWVAQLASLGGVYVLSGLIVAVNAAIACAILKRGTRAFLSAVVVVMAVPALAWSSQAPEYGGRRHFPVACVQAETYKKEVHVDLTRQALKASPSPLLVVLPEHTFVDYPDEHNLRIQTLAAMAIEKQACICVGIHAPAEKGAECAYDNVAMIIGPAGKVVGQQAKCVPVPFFDDGNPARRQAPVSTELGRLGVYVCYDGLFTDHPRRLADQGAELLVVPVMDVDNWPDQEREQHAAMAPMRSIELRRCAVRAASSGVSQVIDATGRVTANRRHNEGPGTLAGVAYLNDARTLFVRVGFVVAPIMATGYVGMIVYLTISQWWRWLRKKKPVVSCQ